MQVSVVMPAFNAERHLRQAATRVLRHPESLVRRLIIVDDGSLDGTAQVARALCACDDRVVVIERSRNGGYGAAMKDGVRAALRVEGGAFAGDLIATIHADGQYAPEVLPDLVREMTEQGLDLLQGSRIAGGQALQGGMPLYKYVANAFLNRLENWVLALRLSDFHSGYLLYKPTVLDCVKVEHLSDSFDFDIELIAAARAQGLSIGEAPIPTRYANELSHLRPIPYGLRVLRVLWKYRRGDYGNAPLHGA